MTKKEFQELIGEDPEDVFGPDWENDLEDMELLSECCAAEALGTIENNIAFCSKCKERSEFN